ncbi:MAG: lipid II:glycine glycyltransferase FemX [Oscillospiraceae bacterium]
MSILEKENPQQREEFESFVSTHESGSFMQSLMWPQVKTGWDYEGIIVRNPEGQVCGTALALFKKIPLLGCTLMYLPRGPVCDFHDEWVLSEITKEIKALAKKHNSYECIADPFVRVEDIEARNAFEKLGFVCDYDAPEGSTVQVRDNYMLFIGGRDYDKLFEDSSSKCRYNTRLAVRKGVECKIGTEADLADFVNLMRVTGKRDGFNTRDKAYFERFLKALGEHARLYMCYFEGKPISGAITTQYAGKTCYVYGASSNEHRNLMPNNLMQWAMIKWAVDGDSYVYDFQGIPHYKEEEHPSFGMYRFKRSFNGEIVSFVGEYKLCFSAPKKRLVDFLEKCYGILNSIKRKLRR